MDDVAGIRHMTLPCYNRATELALMPLFSFSELHTDPRLQRVSVRLRDLRQGVVLGTGQASSGKLTNLLALAMGIAGDDRKVVLMTDRLEHFAPFRPLLSTWREVELLETKTAWEQALGAQDVKGAVIVVAPLSRESAPAAMAAGRHTVVLAAVDTVLPGLDTSYALRELGIPYQEFAEVVSCVWSQFLVETLCVRCAVRVHSLPEGIEFPLSVEAKPLCIKTEVGCAQCDHKGTQGRDAISDVTFITDSARAAVATALAQGLSVDMGKGLHIPALERAQEMLLTGVIGLKTYREVIQRNPLLRAQLALTLAAKQTAKLTSMFDAYVVSLWIDLEALTSVANRTSAGVVVVEATGEVRFASTRARQLLHAVHDLDVIDERLHAGTTKMRRALDDALAKAVAVAPTATRLGLQPKSGGRSYMFVTPLPATRGFGAGMRRLALLVFGSTDQAEALPREQDLRQFFDFTPAESRVALLLCGGLVPKQVASELAVSISTVRTHLRAILAKTGTSRQAQLVRLLATLPRVDESEPVPAVQGIHR
jgi:DNA-binding CsgD family transcriptional regulator